MNNINFVKYNGLGNNFLLVDNCTRQISSPSQLAAAMCDIHFGIGADGLILAEKSGKYDITMRIFNSDGSEAEMCGNGVRCFTKFVLDYDILKRDTLTVATLAGPVKCERISTTPGRDLIAVDMGEPAFSSKDFTGREKTVINGREYIFVSMGNPHAVTFVDNFDFDYQQTGSIVENHTRLFPSRTNVEFVKKESTTAIAMRVWERGCGETMACGTGACAAAVAAVKQGLLERSKNTVHLRGGDLEIEWQQSNRLLMTGAADLVCEGRYFDKSREKNDTNK
ncbi:MAG TPA: diaminopimelate epimerase [Spirochaetota bacterium]|nr:diaminopimelate epimerase [Spirochaetota bacterium]